MKLICRCPIVTFRHLMVELFGKISIEMTKLLNECFHRLRLSREIIVSTSLRKYSMFDKSFIGIYTLKWLIYCGLESIYNEIDITLLNLSIVHITRLDNKTKFFHSSSICQKKFDHIYHIHVNYSQCRMVTSGEWKDMINFAHENNTACKIRVACLHTCPVFLRSCVWSGPTHSRWDVKSRSLLPSALC